MAATSTFVARAISSTSSGSLAAPRPMLCGNTVAPNTAPFPCTASTPYRIGMPRRVDSAASSKPTTMSRHPAASFCAG